jgi:beta-phosphoglucomutase-like phosphatase (HAD superfamily)
MNSTPVPFKTVPQVEVLKKAYPGVKALFFDMDGTLFNTESLHAKALFKMAEKYKIRPPRPPEEIHALMIGKADHLIFDILKDWEGVPGHWNVDTFVKEKNDHILEFLELTPHDSYFAPSVQLLLKELKEHDLYLALVTSSERLVTERLLKRTGLDEYFHLILTRDDCPVHKPDPWPYLKAREISGFAQHEILIFEDSQVGIEAAIQSGHHVIKVEWY